MQRRNDIALALFERRFSRAQIDGRSRSRLNLTAIVFKLCARQLNRVTRDSFVVDGKYQIPVSALHLIDDLDDALAELAVREVERFLGDLD